MGTKLKHYSTIGTNDKEVAEKFYDELLSLVNAKKFPANDRITTVSYTHLTLPTMLWV